MKPKKTLSAYILLVGVLGLSVVGGILLFGIYSALVKTQITTQQTTLIKPLDGEISVEILNGLQKRRKFNATELSTVIAPSVVQSPTSSIEASVVSQ